MNVIRVWKHGLKSGTEGRVVGQFGKIPRRFSY